ncbi:MAG: exo-alpha-sialidase [Planctomycetes bacterium]|nr:exo-alpha-sialidase [Planctomycetota bacterium]
MVARALGIVGIAALAPLLAAQKPVDTRVDTSGVPSGATEPRIAAQGGSLYVVWSETRSASPDPDVYFNKSEDGGATWLAFDVRLNTNAAGASSSTEPRIAVDGSNIVAVWSDDREGPYRVYYNRSGDGGLTWRPLDDRLDTLAVGMGTGSQDTAAAGGHVYAVWVDYRFGAGADIFFNRSSNGGQTWRSSDARLTTGPSGLGASTAPQVAASETNVYVAWQKDPTGSGTWGIYFNRSRDGGANWLGSEVRLDVPAASDALAPRITESGPHVYVVWQSDRSGTDAIYLNRSSDFGQTWNGETRIDTAPGVSSYAPRIAAAGSMVYVAWESAVAGRARVFLNRSADHAATWEPSQRRIDHAPASIDARHPRLAATGLSVFVAWQDSRLGRAAVFANRSVFAGTNWLGADIRLSRSQPATASAISADLAASPSIVAAAWVDDRADVYGDIYMNLQLGAQPFGTGLAGSGGITPRLAIPTLPAIGASLSLELSAGLGGAPAGIGLGLGGPGALPFLGGTLHVSAPVIFRFLPLGGAGPGQGAGAIALALPPDPMFLGTEIAAQGFVLDAAAAAGVAMTGGLDLWIG